MAIVNARETSERLLRRLPQRLAHVTGVACVAMRVANCLGSDTDLLTSAAWLHDIGYAPGVGSTGFHALDGARFLSRQGAPAPVVNLVAHHSYALIEAELRGLRNQLEAEFPCDASLPHDLLCYCDMTTGPSGESVTVEQRLSEIRDRYGPGDLVTEFVGRAEKDIVGAVERVERSLVGAAQSK